MRDFALYCEDTVVLLMGSWRGKRGGKKERGERKREEKGNTYGEGIKEPGDEECDFEEGEFFACYCWGRCISGHAYSQPASYLIYREDTHRYNSSGHN